MLFYVNMNVQANGDHEVHTSDCYWLPEKDNRISLGRFDNCRDAVKEAKKYYLQSNGCKHCSEPCHTQ